MRVLQLAPAPGGQGAEHAHVRTHLTYRYVRKPEACPAHVATWQAKAAQVVMLYAMNLKLGSLADSLETQAYVRKHLKGKDAKVGAMGGPWCF